MDMKSVPPALERNWRRLSRRRALQLYERWARPLPRPPITPLRRARWNAPSPPPATSMQSSRSPQNARQQNRGADALPRIAGDCVWRPRRGASPIAMVRPRLTSPRSKNPLAYGLARDWVAADLGGKLARCGSNIRQSRAPNDDDVRTCSSPSADGQALARMTRPLRRNADLKRVRG